jgi:hypothetical protein
MGSVNIQFVEQGSNYEGRVIENPLLKYKGEPLTDKLAVLFDTTGRKVSDNSKGLEAKIVVDPATLSFTSLCYMWEAGAPVLGKDGLQRCYVSSHGFFDQGGGKYTIRTKGPVIHVPWKILVERGRMKAQMARMAKKRAEALQQFESAVKKGNWSPTRLFDFGISFPDFSYWTWEKGEEQARIAKVPVGPKASLAEMWGGWTPDMVLTPDVAPPKHKESISRGIEMLKNVSCVDHLSLLPEKEDRSPILLLDGDGLRVNRVVEVPENLK